MVMPSYWQPLDLETVGLMATMGILAGLGWLLFNTALGVARTVSVMPLHYTVIGLGDAVRLAAVGRQAG